MILRWKKPVSCFFCNEEPVPKPPNPRHFRCPKCDCLNRYDENGEIVSDEGAMYDESMNTAAFSKRGSPRKDKLPSVHTPRVFCRTCQTNQTLYVNLLSNYLPDEDDPNYDRLLAQLPEYKDSLAARYPLVCSNCSDNVEEELKKSSRLGRSNALGSWLQGGEDTSHARTSLTSSERRSSAVRWRDLWIWRMRGAMWTTSLASSITFSVVALRSKQRLTDFQPEHVALIPIIAFASIFWAFWDPLWSGAKSPDPYRANRRKWIGCQFVSWATRLTTSVLFSLGMLTRSWILAHLAVESILVVLSGLALHQDRRHTTSVRLVAGRTRSLTPYPTTLISTSANPQAAIPGASTSIARLASVDPAQSDDFFSTLSLSADPSSVIRSQSPSAPIFGQTSLLGGSRLAPPPPQADTVKSEDSMDWDPTSDLPGQPSASTRMYDWMRPQRFFPPSEPTGLEGLLETTTISTFADQDSRSGNGTIPAVRVNRSGARPARRAGDAMGTYLVALLIACMAASALLLRTGSWSLLHRWNGSASDVVASIPHFFPNHADVGHLNDVY